MDAKELNEYAAKKKENLQQHGYLENLQIADSEMRANPNKFDKQFYLTKEDEVSEILGEILDTYGKLKAELEKFIVKRKVELLAEAESNDDKNVTVKGEKIKFSRLAGFAEDLAKSEVSGLYGTCIYLHYVKERAENAVKTSRNHTYSLDNNSPDRK